MDQESPTKVLARITQTALDAADKVSQMQAQEAATTVLKAGAGTAGAIALAALLTPGPGVTDKSCGRC